MIPNEPRGNQKLEGVATGYLSHGPERVPCNVHLRYCAHHPYVVMVSASTPHSASASAPASVSAADPGGGEWRVSRDLLSAGLTAPAGIGEVRVQPEASDGQDLQVRISIRGLDGESLLCIGHRALLQYLEYTHAVVPFGSETLVGRIDEALDNALDGILGEG